MQQLVCNKAAYTKLCIHSTDGFLLRVGYVSYTYKRASLIDIKASD